MEVSYKFKDENELKVAVSKWIKDEKKASNEYGNIKDWDVSQVTDMRYMFEGAESFNQDISEWNVSQVTDMQDMFKSARSFNQDIGKWNVSQVTDMSYMFDGAEHFNQDIGKWNVSQVRDMSYMFNNAERFSQDINTKEITAENSLTGAAYTAWNVSHVTDMSSMFSGAAAFNQAIGQWNVSQVTDMYAMFRDAAAFNQDIGQWNVSQVTNMESMFWGAAAFNQDIGRWPIKLAALNRRDTFTNSGVSKETFLKPPNGTGEGVYGVAIGTYFGLPEPHVSYDRLLQSIIDKKNLAKAGVIKLLNKDLEDPKVKNKIEVDNKIRVFELGDKVKSFLGGSRYKITYTE